MDCSPSEPALSGTSTEGEKPRESSNDGDSSSRWLRRHHDKPGRLRPTPAAASYHRQKFASPDGRRSRSVERRYHRQQFGSSDGGRSRSAEDQQQSGSSSDENSLTVDHSSAGGPANNGNQGHQNHCYQQSGHEAIPSGNPIHRYKRHSKLLNITCLDLPYYRSEEETLGWEQRFEMLKRECAPWNPSEFCETKSIHFFEIGTVFDIMRLVEDPIPAGECGSSEEYSYKLRGCITTLMGAIGRGRLVNLPKHIEPIQDKQSRKEWSFIDRATYIYLHYLQYIHDAKNQHWCNFPSFQPGTNSRLDRSLLFSSIKPCTKPEGLEQLYNDLITYAEDMRWTHDIFKTAMNMLLKGALREVHSNIVHLPFEAYRRRLNECFSRPVVAVYRDKWTNFSRSPNESVAAAQERACFYLKKVALSWPIPDRDYRKQAEIMQLLLRIASPKVAARAASYCKRRATVKPFKLATLMDYWEEEELTELGDDKKNDPTPSIAVNSVKFSKRANSISQSQKRRTRRKKADYYWRMAAQGSADPRAGTD